MTQPTNPADFMDCAPDAQLLGEGMRDLPAVEQRPPPPAAGHARGRLVGAGAALTGISLLAGLALVLLGALDALLRGGARAADLVAGVAGAVLIATHWGWVHAAEAIADGIESRRCREARARNQLWLETVKPFVRYSVATSVLADGSIQIARIRHRPVRTADGTFTFMREHESHEVRAAEESAAEVAGRAETLRRQAALDTERERRRWEIAADAYETVMLGRDDEQQRLAARRAVSEALSEQINANLREPPLVE